MAFRGRFRESMVAFFLCVSQIFPKETPGPSLRENASAFRKVSLGRSFASVFRKDGTRVQWLITMLNKWMFQKIGVGPQNGRFLFMENLIEMDD